MVSFGNWIDREPSRFEYLHRIIAYLSLGLILIPRVAGITELYELSQADQEQFLRESSWLSSQLARVFRADKMNVAALGNMVPQLHFHHVVRYQNDIAWPKPVWGTPAVPYSNEVLAHMRQTLMLALRGQGDMPFDWRMD